MRIAKLTIENFRSIKKLEVDLPNVCALVGPNNTGKSNILLAIQRVVGRDWINASAFDENDIYGRNAEREIRIALSVDPPIQYRRFKNSDPVEIATLSFLYTRYKIGEHKGEPRLERKCLAPNGNEIFVPKRAPQKGVAQQVKDTDVELLTGIPQEVRDLVPVIYVGTNRSIKEHLPSARYSLLRSLFDDIDRDLHDPGCTVKVRRDDGVEEEIQRVDHFRRLLEQAMELLRTDNFREVETTIKRNALRQLGFDPDTDTDQLDLFFSPPNTTDFYRSLDLRIREGDFTVSATELGEGIQNALVISILRTFEERRKKGAILLIDEPEMFLHPQMQRSLYKTLRRIGETNQVIYTTHSPHFVTVPEFHEIFIIRKNIEGTFVCRSNLPYEDKRKEKLIKELDPERSELFFATRLLLVEGDTEKLALPEYAKQLGLDLDKEGATIIEVGGKRNLFEFARISCSFGIPTGVLYDEDSSDFKDKKSEEEKQFNDQLDGLPITDGAMVWKLSKNYEGCLRRTLGESKYQELCQKYPQVSKPVKARLIASENGLAIPDELTTALNWLANQ
jgi:predicted ATP-dependent endonuclease of OLD family